MWLMANAGAPLLIETCLEKVSETDRQSTRGELQGTGRDREREGFVFVFVMSAIAACLQKMALPIESFLS